MSASSRLGIDAMTRPDCCGEPMRKKGWREGKQDWLCLGECKRRTVYPDRPAPSRYRLRLTRNSPKWVICWGSKGFPVHRRNDGRWIVFLGAPHPWSDQAGNAYLYRFIVMTALHRHLRPDEHVHHIAEDLDDNLSLEQLELVLAEYHGSIHAYHTTLASPSELSRHVEASLPYGTRQVSRYKAIIGPAAEQA